MNIFYNRDIDSLILDKEESHHCSKVLRMRPGDQITLIDGCGCYANAELTIVTDKRTEYLVLDKKENYNSLNYNLHIAIAPTKNMNRFEWFVEKATEIGISEITPIVSDNSERKVLKKDRLEKLIIAACKQSRKARFPKLNELKDFRSFIGLAFEMETKKMIAHCYPNERQKMSNVGNLKNTVLCIGPEGDFSQNEIEEANKMGYINITMGKSRLRTETAAVYACAAINLLNQA